MTGSSNNIPRTDEETNVVRKACVWHESLKAKIVAPVGAKTQAVKQHERDGDKLAEAVEMYKKRGGQP